MPGLEVLISLLETPPASHRHSIPFSCSLPGPSSCGPTGRLLGIQERTLSCGCSDTSLFQSHHCRPFAPSADQMFRGWTEGGSLLELGARGEVSVSGPLLLP